MRAEKIQQLKTSKSKEAYFLEATKPYKFFNHDDQIEFLNKELLRHKIEELLKTVNLRNPTCKDLVHISIMLYTEDKPATSKRITLELFSSKTNTGDE